MVVDLGSHLIIVFGRAKRVANTSCSAFVPKFIWGCAGVRMWAVGQIFKSLTAPKETVAHETSLAQTSLRTFVLLFAIIETAVARNDSVARHFAFEDGLTAKLATNAETRPEWPLKLAAKRCWRERVLLLFVLQPAKDHILLHLQPIFKSLSIGHRHIATGAYTTFLQHIQRRRPRL